MKNMFRLDSVKKKMILGFLSVIFINLVIFLTLEISNTYGKLQESALDKSSAYAEHIEKIISPIGIENSKKIQQEISSLLKKQYNSVEYIGVLDDNLKYVSNTDKGKIGTYFKNSNVDTLIEKNRSNSFVLKTNGKNGYFSVVPLYSTSSGTSTDAVSSATEKDSSSEKVDNVSSASTKVTVPGLIVVKMDNDVLLRDFRKQIIKLILISSIILILSIIIAFFISLSITKPLKQIQFHLKLMSKGDLTNKVKINSKDEMLDLAENINTTNSTLKNIISKIRSSAKDVDDYSNKLNISIREVNLVSDEITNSLQDVNETSIVQNNNLSQAYEKLNNFSEDLDTIGDKILSIEKNTVEIKGNIDTGKEAVNGVSTSLNEVSDSFKDLEDTIKALSDKVTNIHSISNTISEVAKQINLLSLNASIEASRANESGGGFKVVASEVKKLSIETIESSGIINNLIQDIYSNTKLVTSTTLTSIDKFNQQNKSISNTLAMFERIVDQINSIVPQIKEISQITKSFVSMKDGIIENVKYTTFAQNELSSAIEDVSKSMEEQSATISDLSDLSQNLHKVSNDVTALIKIFKI
ncbi:MAG: methyl-accepting chemotaxis protein [Clostridium sp.]|jgi:methyl-accepting chemotaxis protein|uniref:methyl-accepting chemotaxis protein n=1 Tax=Clostridium sp. TaxID=1506 RepID=UPI0025C3AA7D|nr:methyl-accepting chemotaxis protein [Clostridium sp.]MCH3964973.1 methyl-accepting chemotaxis protein [Clostridium sp.]MCI1716533.1 methyl-accepting chemotaxis protein [Clostridium sp.]MCI1800985.1 methyl-accepting chemotaxis protein [Clostridium sp.]MCI1814710.1 methyl-accepting chemotaxis protein [Clostridium sp.]MCI1871732.1 methyl-accepting chemotaxis protein [Clostridium sp.]